MQQLYVLHRQPLNESDWLLTVFSRESGRLTLVTPGRRHQIELVLHTSYQADWRKAADWPRIVAASERDVCHLEGDALFCGLYANELLVRLLMANEPAPALYDHYASVLAALSRGDHPEPWLRILEYQALQHAGYGFSWGATADGRPLSAGQRYDFVAGTGLISSSSGTYRAEWLLPFTGIGKPDETSWRCAKQILRLAIDAAMERPLVSRQLFSWRNE